MGSAKIELQAFNQLYLAAFYTLVALFYTLRIKLFRPQAPSCEFVHMGKSGTLHWWNHLTFRVFRILIWGVCVARLIWPQMDAWLIFVPLSAIPVVVICGMLMLASGFALAIWGNLLLSGLWRSGVDSQGPGRLVTHSLYRYSRNPIFIGVMLGQLGFFLALPGWFSLTCLLVGWTAVGVQIYLEEQHLQEKLPVEYGQYRRNTARWWGSSKGN
ncbi:hypothetical protein GCM10027098_05600 [Bowmanella dokdonensis]